MYYECHVTVAPLHSEIFTPIAEVHKFKYSVLKGDEVMGDDKLGYFTCHDRDAMNIEKRMNSLVDCLELMQIKPLRQKIEHVILDKRF